MSGSGGSGENARAAGVRSGPSAVRCGYGSSLTSPRSLIRSGPGPLLIRRSLRIRQGGCGRRYRAGTGPVSRTGGSYLRSAAGPGRFCVPSHGASPRPIRAWRALLPQACGPAAADSRVRKVARHRQVRAVALDQAADDARGIKHALDTDRRGQPGSARPCSVTFGHRSLPCTAWSARSRTRPCERPGSSTAVRLSGRARLTLPMLLPPRARLSDPLAAAAPGSAILCARASHGPLRRCRCRRALGAPRTRLP